MAEIAGVWTEEQNDAVVADYFAMLADDMIGRANKHQNISAVLKGLGDDWIPGY